MRRGRSAARERGLAAVDLLVAELVGDAQQLVVLGDAVAARQATGLDLAGVGRDSRSAMKASSVSPERCEMTEV